MAIVMKQALDRSIFGSIVFFWWFYRFSLYVVSESKQHFAKKVWQFFLDFLINCSYLFIFVFIVACLICHNPLLH